MVEPDIVSEAQRHLAVVYNEQGHLAKSAEMYKAALM
jgi:Tfp pilus assembly protein PilF